MNIILKKITVITGVLLIILSSCTLGGVESGVVGSWRLHYLKIGGEISGISERPYNELIIFDDDTFKKKSTLFGQYDDNGMTLEITGSVEGDIFSKSISFKYDGSSNWDEYVYEVNSDYLILKKDVDGVAYEYCYARPGLHD